MAKIFSSPERYTFQMKKFKEKLKDDPDDKDSLSMLNFYESWKEKHEQEVHDVEWQKNNLEYDLRSTEWLCEKAKQSKTYAQNLYAALCNNDFQKLDVLPILKGEEWSCSWRYAGGIVADMLEEGDYIDWYCSGIRGDLIETADSNGNPEESKFVPESVVTDEIREDLKKIGWIVVTEDEK